jgi:peptidoglycan/xylan/chitin deacetylase (PgdA/CDA1 family)
VRTGAPAPSAATRSRLDRVLKSTPLQPLFLWRAQRSLVALAYHRVQDGNRFAEHLDWLQANRRPVSIDEVTTAMRGATKLPRGSVLITFDDGDRSLVDVALPLLRDRGIPAVAFVVPGLIDTRTPFWWVEVTMLLRRGARCAYLPADPARAVRKLKAVPDEQRHRAIAALRRAGPTVETPQLRSDELPMLASAGVAIGNHTLTHRCLTRCSDDVLTEEIVAAHELLTEALPSPPTIFAYPDGEDDPRARRVLQRLGYRLSFLFDHRINRLPIRRPFAMSRVRIDADASLDRLRIVSSGLHPTIHRLRGKK